MKWMFYNKSSTGLIFRLILYIPYISISKMEKVEIGEDSYITTFNFPTNLTMKETKKSITVIVKIIGFGFKVEVRQT